MTVMDLEVMEESVANRRVESGYHGKKRANNKPAIPLSLFILRYSTTMLQKFSFADKILFVAAFLSLIYSEVLFFSGDKDHGIFLGLWVPTILLFGIYLKIINNSKHE